MAAHRLSRLPSWLSRWLGYRSVSPSKQPEYLICFWSFIGAFCGLSVLQAVFGQAQYFIGRHVPSIVASYVRLSYQLYVVPQTTLSLNRTGSVCGPMLWSH